MKSIFQIPFWCFVIGVGHLAYGAPEASPSTGLSLTEAVQEAEGKNPDLQALGFRAERMGWAKLEAWSGHLPQLSIDFDRYLKTKYLRQNVILGGNPPISFPAAYPESSLTVNASLNLFDGLKTIFQIKAADKNAEAAELDYSRAKFKLEREVRRRYYRALAAQKLLEVAEQNVKTLEDHLSIARSSERAGYGLRVDVLRIQANLDEAVAEQGAARDNVDIERASLSEVMGIESDSRGLTGELPVLKASDVPADLALTLDRREDVQAQILREEASENLGLAAKGAWLPAVSVFGQLQYYKFGDSDPAILANDKFENAYAVGLRLTWSLFDGGSTISRERQASYRAKEDESALRSVYTHLPREFLTWKKKFFYNVSLYQARVKTLEQSQESVRLSMAGAKAGTRTNTEVLDAELDLFRARAGIIRAQSDAIEALNELELAVGYPLRKGI